MSDVRMYSVFVSSTRGDLLKEREVIIRSLLECECYPIAMEYFDAASNRTWAVIKSKVESCDVFLLCLKGRYGSCDGDGVGFTEKEYEYARSLNKPLLAFVHENPATLAEDDRDADPSLRERFGAFRARVLADAKVKMWSTATELASAIAPSLAKTLRVAAPSGWVRASQSVTARLWNLLRCTDESIAIASTCPADTDLETFALGLDLSIGGDYVHKAIRSFSGRAMSLNVLIMAHDPGALGPLAPEEVRAWTRNVPGSMERIIARARAASTSVDPRSPLRAQRIAISLRQYAGLPSLHGFVMRKPRFISYSSMCRFIRSERTYEWGTDEYSRFEGEPDPSGGREPLGSADERLAASLNGLIDYLWTNSTPVWELRSEGGCVVRDALTLPPGVRTRTL